ncbi:MAG: FecR protein [Fibrobacterota bacterium]|jgi:hypothetical protein
MKMRLMTLLCLLGLAIPALSEPLAVIVRTKGEVWLGQGKTPATARSGDVIQEGAQISTGADGRALIRFMADQSIAEIKPGSVVLLNKRVREDGTVLRRVFLQAGDAAFGITPGKGRDLRFESATTVASVRGTQFGMKVEGGKTRLGVSEGVVRVCHTSLGSTVHVSAGGEVVVSEEGIEFTQGTPAPDSEGVQGQSIAHRIAVDFQGAVSRKPLQIDWDSTSTKASAVRKYDPALFQLVNP